jgi:hypothetical protein
LVDHLHFGMPGAAIVAAENLIAPTEQQLTGLIDQQRSDGMATFLQSQQGLLATQASPYIFAAVCAWSLLQQGQMCWLHVFTFARRGSKSMHKSCACGLSPGF